MANLAILDAVAAAWSKHGGNGKKMLDLSCGDGDTARLLTRLGYRIVATDYGPLPPMTGIERVGGVDLNHFYRFSRVALTPSISSRWSSIPRINPSSFERSPGF